MPHQKERARKASPSPAVRANTSRAQMMLRIFSRVFGRDEKPADLLSTRLNTGFSSNN